MFAPSPSLHSHRNVKTYLFHPASHAARAAAFSYSNSCASLAAVRLHHFNNTKNNHQAMFKDSSTHISPLFITELRMSASMSEFAVNVGFESIAGTEDSYVLREWLPGVEADCLFDTIVQARGFDMQHVAYVEATRDVDSPSSGKANDTSKEEESPLISDASFWIPQLAVSTATPRARSIKSLVVWNHASTAEATQTGAVAQMLRKMARHVDLMLDDMAADKGESRARDSEASNNYITVRHLVDRQRIDMRHMEPEAGNSVDSSQNPVCLLALGGERTLCLRVWGMDPDEPAHEIPLTHGCLVVLTPNLLANGCSYAVRPPKGGRKRASGGYVIHPPHAPHVLLEIRAVERFCRVDASWMHGT